MTTKAKQFMSHNDKSPIVVAEWLDKDKRTPKGASNTWVFLRVELQDGTQYVLDDDDRRAMGEAGYRSNYHGVGRVG